MSGREDHPSRDPGDGSDRVPERRSAPDPDALGRPPAERVAFDVEKLKKLKEAAYHPLIEYLTYIQVQRGDEEASLVFIRSRDLDSLAALSGEGEADDPLEKLRKLGVLLSLN